MALVPAFPVCPHWPAIQPLAPDPDSYAGRGGALLDVRPSVSVPGARRAFSSTLSAMLSGAPSMARRLAPPTVRAHTLKRTANHSKSMLRRKGIRVVSITEQADDSATGRLLEGIIESVDEFYSENLAQEVVRGMREVASRGFFLGSKAPFGYRRVKVNDRAKERPTLEVDPGHCPGGEGDIRELAQWQRPQGGMQGPERPGRHQQGQALVQGRTPLPADQRSLYRRRRVGRQSKGEKAQDPVRVEGAWPALVSRALFKAVQRAMKDRAPKVQRPGRVGSKFLLSGLLKCGVCGRPYSGQGAKSGQFAYYVCGTLFREGAGTCSARYLNAPRVEDFVVEKIRDAHPHRGDHRGACEAGG